MGHILYKYVLYKIFCINNMHIPVCMCVQLLIKTKTKEEKCAKNTNSKFSEKDS